MSCGQYTESAVGRISVVTSSTRPTGASRYVGQRIYETDTSRELLYDGTGWVIMSEPIQTYTPTWTAVTLGAGSVSQGYSRRSGGWCSFVSRFTLGTGGALTGSLGVNLPYQSGVGMTAPLFRAHCLDAAVNEYPLSIYTVSDGASAVSVGTHVSSGTFASLSAANATQPFTWGVGDACYIAGHYPMNTRYL